MAITIPFETLSVGEKIQMMESLWDNLCASVDSIDSPAWHEKTLMERESLLKNGADCFEDWESAKNAIRKQVSWGAASK